MNTYKIHNSERQRKRERERDNKLAYLTPPKLLAKNSVINTVARWEKHCGYDYDVPEY